MISKNTAYVLEVALANDKVADEIAARLISAAPVDANEAQTILDVLDLNMNKKIEEYLIVAMASRVAGKELAKKINGLTAVLQAQADGEEVAATFAQFEGQVAGMTTDVTIDADVAGLAGNITLVADSLTDIDGLIAAWNLANPANEVTLSAGDGSQIPTANIVLAGGTDASDANLVPSQEAMGSDHMSAATFEILVVAMASRAAAQDFKDAFNTMIDAAQAI